MATGDATDMRQRLIAVLPPWFGDSNPIRDALLAAAASVLAFAYSLYAYAKDQTRIATATGIWLDLIAFDFFGTALPRGASESDASYRARILASLLRPRATRAAISSGMLALTGHTPKIIEPFSPADCGAYGIGLCAYGAAGAYGSDSLPAQAFMTVYRPTQSGIANVAGYGFPQAGYSSAGQSEYASLSMMGTGVSDAEIYAAVKDIKAAGVTMWVRIAPMHLPLPVTINSAPFTLDGAPITV